MPDLGAKAPFLAMTKKLQSICKHSSIPIKLGVIAVDVISSIQDSRANL